MELESQQPSRSDADHESNSSLVVEMLKDSAQQTRVSTHETLGVLSETIGHFSILVSVVGDDSFDETSLPGAGQVPLAVFSRQP